MRRAVRIALVLLFVVSQLVVSGVVSADTESAQVVHVVRRGETLASIAARYGVSVGSITQANSLRNANFIWVGQRLVIPSGNAPNPNPNPGSGAVYYVRRGDTLANIAARYSISLQALMSANGIRNPNLIYVGQRLVIPGRSNPAPAPTPKPQPKPNPNPGTSGRWIDIDLSEQRLRAYEGNTVVLNVLVSTGIARYPTPPGRFAVRTKVRAQTMSGPGYRLPNVQWVMYFYKAYAIHGTYWHNNFGRPMSHGCINLTNADAQFMYNWASIGTPVVIHW
ncbi:MAG: LysM peptidoglycan-binding domain-containing protein [Anaerolineae bacterium]|nr:LysM peptidoglycan-binding domain-containing protein [Anaerolineae bacterium]